MAKWATAKQFMDATINKKYDMDNYPSYQKFQCWDYGDFFWTKQVGRMLSTGGTGCARGCWNVATARKANAGKDFELITDKKSLKVGDWVVLNTGAYGHIGIVYEIVKKGTTVKIQGQNQGAIITKVSRVNFNLNTFLGAFRYKNWNKTAPKQQTKYKTYTVKKGDTLSKIASKYKTTWQKLAKDNGIANANLIYPGQKIIIK